jgi:hypothetical protein
MPGHKARPYFKNNKHEKGWQSSSSSRVSAQKAGGPEFNPKYCQKIEIKTIL